MMDLPLFPLNVVLFPGMVLPLKIFEPRYREMISRCIQDKSPFGVVLSGDRREVGELVEPHTIGTAARIMRVDEQPDGRMNIATVGTQRFRINSLNHSKNYLSADVSHFPVINGSTKRATEIAQKVRPKIIEYVDLLVKATNIPLQLDRIPQDPTTLTFLIAIALQVNNEDKQKLLSIAGIPEMLIWENHLLSREVLLLQHMLETHADIEMMSSGPTGAVFPN